MGDDRTAERQRVYGSKAYVSRRYAYGSIEEQLTYNEVVVTRSLLPYVGLQALLFGVAF